jgi:hypothetical protein
VNAAGIRGRSCSAGSRHSAAINSGRPASRGDERDVVAGVGMDPRSSKETDTHSKLS